MSDLLETVFGGSDFHAFIVNCVLTLSFGFSNTNHAKVNNLSIYIYLPVLCG